MGSICRDPAEDVVGPVDQFRAFLYGEQPMIFFVRYLEIFLGAEASRQSGDQEQQREHSRHTTSVHAILGNG